MRLFSNAAKKFSLSTGGLACRRSPETRRLDLFDEHVFAGTHVLQDEFRASSCHPIKFNHHQLAAGLERLPE